MGSIQNVDPGVFFHEKDSGSMRQKLLAFLSCISVTSVTVHIVLIH